MDDSRLLPVHGGTADPEMGLGSPDDSMVRGGHVNMFRQAGGSTRQGHGTAEQTPGPSTGPAPTTASVPPSELRNSKGSYSPFEPNKTYNEIIMQHQKWLDDRLTHLHEAVVAAGRAPAPAPSAADEARLRELTR